LPPLRSVSGAFPFSIDGKYWTSAAKETSSNVYRGADDDDDDEKIDS